MNRITVDDKEVKKIMIGNKVIWERPEPGTVWLRCPTGPALNTFMMYERESGIAYFETDGRYDTIGNGAPIQPRLVLQLPKGFSFGKGNPTKVDMSTGYGDYAATYDGDKLYVNFGNGGQYVTSAAISADYLKDKTIWGFSFYVIKED